MNGAVLECMDAVLWSRELGDYVVPTLLADADLRWIARRAWNTNEGGALRAARAEAKRRGIEVA